VQLWPENQVVWQKLAIVAPYALATTAVAGSIGVVRANKEVLDHLRIAAGEAVDVAAAMGVDLNKTKVMDTLERYPDAMRVSMERDLAAGRDLEIANVADPIIREGERKGVSVASLRWLRDRAVAQAAARKG
jgi:2-dehydropantoate 2-reductase